MEDKEVCNQRGMLKYKGLVEELENIDYNCYSFPILLYQNNYFRETIYAKIEKLRNKPIFPADLFCTIESKVLLNEMFKHWSMKEGCFKAIKRIDENMKEVINYEGDEKKICLKKYEMYYKRLSVKNRKLLYKEIEVENH